MKRRSATLATVLFASLVVMSCQKPNMPSSSASPIPATFVGTMACEPCHKEIVQVHQKTRHSATLRFATVPALGSLMPPAGKVPGSNFAVARPSGTLVIQSEDRSKSLPVALAFGSGKTGMTFAAVFPEATLFEINKSYFAPERHWYTTPGQEEETSGRPGKQMTAEISQRCVLCHAVTLEPGKIVPESRFMGVGCEACHGPGSKHIEEAQAGRTSKSWIVGLKAAPGGLLLEACGKCHRAASQINNAALSGETQRFQSYGLSLSACYKKSNETLSCTTCHDPHADVSHDTARYEQTCLRCHGASSSPNPKTIIVAKACPVNKTEHCIGCHMPQRPAFADTDLPTTMADHFIRKNKQ